MHRWILGNHGHDSDISEDKKRATIKIRAARYGVWVIVKQYAKKVSGQDDINALRGKELEDVYRYVINISTAIEASHGGPLQ